MLFGTDCTFHAFTHGNIFDALRSCVYTDRCVVHWYRTAVRRDTPYR